MLPNFLIIGAPRAGTTWIQKNIKDHPDIFMPAEKELHFFNNNYDKGIEYYENFFKGVKNEKAIGEATPDYLHIEKVPERIHHDLGSNLKFIISLRNPVDRVYSRFWNAKSKYKANKYLSFEEKINQKPEFIEEGYYFKNINRYLKYCKPDQFLFLLYEDIKNDPDAFLKKIYNFLEIDPSYQSSIQNAKINSASSKPNLGKSRALFYSSKVVKRLGLKNLAYSIEKMNMIEYPEMNPETKKWLTNEVYKEENLKLQNLTGINLEHWNKIKA